MAVTFDTIFKIGAVFTGAAAMNQAQQAVTNLEQKGLLAGLSLKKMVVGIGGLAAGYMTVDKLTGFINTSIDAARKAKAAYQGIYDSLAKVPQIQKLGTSVIKDQSDKLKELAVTMQRTGIIASESLAGAFTKLIDEGFSPAKIAAMSAPFQDMIVRVKGVKASAEDAAAIADKLGTAIVKGGQEGGQALVELGAITQDQVDKFASLKNANERYNYTLGEMRKHVGDTAEAMKTWDGVQQRFQNAWKDIKVAIGTPFMQAQDKVTEKMQQIQEKLIENAGKISEIITPMISKYTDKIGDFLIKLVDNIDKYAPQIEQFGAIISKAFSFLMAHGTEVAAGATAITTALGVFGIAGGVAGNINKITMAISGLKTAWDLLSKVNIAGIVAIMTNPATWIVVGIAALAAGIYLLVTHWEDVKKAAISAWDAIVVAWGNAASWVDVNVVKPITNLFGGLVSKIQVGDVWGAFVEWVKVSKKIDEFVIATIVNSFGGLVNLIGEAIGQHNLWEVFQKWGTDTTKWIQENVINPIVDLFKGLPKLITDALQGLASAVTAPFQKAASSVQGVWGAVTGFFGGNKGGAPSAPGAPGVGGASAGVGGATGGVSSSTMGVGGSYGGTKFTHYGYPGDSTPDKNSMMGIGDRDNKLIDRYSVALTASERAARFGVSGHSTGQVFSFAGGTYRDDDTAPESDRRIDLYDPTSTAKAAYGGFFAHPGLTSIAERIPEMVIPLEGTSRSRSLLGAAASRIGSGMGRGIGGGNPIHLNMSAPITVNGVHAGQEGAIAQEVQKALQDPIRNLLEQLKKARQYESRLAYA